ncbi:MAG: PorV/PorQ family protein, partial [Ignavibacteriaceae bacterium]
QNNTATFLYWHPSAKYYSMGGIGTAASNDIYSSYYNPAALVFSKRITFTGSFVKPFPFFGNIANSFFGVSFNIDSSNALALSSDLFWLGEQQRTLADSPEPFGVLENLLSWELKLSYGLLLRKNFSAGISLGILKTNLSDKTVGIEQGKGTSTTVLFDAGILLRDILQGSTVQINSDKRNYSSFFNWISNIGEDNKSKGVSLGLDASNLGPDISYVDAEQKDSPPSKITFGISYIPLSSYPADILVGTDFEERLNENNFIDYIHFGGEVRIFKVLAFRGGYFYGTSENLLSYPTYGLGICTKYVSINVARYNRSLESSWHFDSIISLEF